jgi:hypothetical protein
MLSTLATSDSPGDIITGFFFLGILTLLYWLPTIVAITRKHANLGPVIVVNLFLGWTFVGWIVALAMAVNQSQAPVQVYLPPSNVHVQPPASRE